MRRLYVPARPEAMGEWPSMISLAGSWKYHAEPRVPARAHQPDHDTRDWSEIRVPSNWYLQGLDRSGSIWFRRTFRVPRDQAGKRTRLVFDGVDYGAEVWLKRGDGSFRTNLSLSVGEGLGVRGSTRYDYRLRIR